MSRTSLLGLSAVLVCSLAVRGAHAADADDTVMLNNGGRVRGAVIEEDPKLGVRIKLLDGTIRTVKAEDVREVRYHGEAPAAPTAPAAAFPPDPSTAPATAVPAAAPPTAPAANTAPAAPSAPAYAPPPDAAPTPPPHHPEFQIGARLGFALPMGKLNGSGTTSDGTEYLGTPLSDVFTVKIPILIEAGYEVAPGLILGLHAQYGFILDKTGDQGCSAGFSCSDHDVELGIDGQYHFGLGKPIDGWLGLGLGYEWESFSTKGTESTGATEDSSGTTRGPQYLKLQGGADFSVAHALTVGPFLSFSIGEYTHTKYSIHFQQPGAPVIDQSGNQDIPFTALHEWLTIGVKGTFHIGND